MKWNDFFQQSLQDAEDDHVRRRRGWHVDESAVSLRRADGQRLINFATNDYLGLRHDRRLIEAAQRSLTTSGAGAGASPLVSGYNLALAELEKRLAEWHGVQACLVFPSGFGMNVGVLAAILGSDDLVLSDRLNHASLIDGCRLSGAHKRIYAHANVEEVAHILKHERSRYRRVALVTESVFSMDGDLAPLAELQQVCQQYDTEMLVDEAHACGIYGATGAGLGEEASDSTQWLGKLGTLSKAIGACGGYVAGSRALIEFLVNRCRSYIFSTAIAPPVVAASLAAVQIIPSLRQHRERLRQTSVWLREQLRQRGWNVPAGDSPIVPVIVGDNLQTVALSRRLLAAGILVPAIRPPTVPPGTARLRISLCALHTDEQLQYLVEQLSNAKLN